MLEYKDFWERLVCTFSPYHKKLLQDKQRMEKSIQEVMEISNSDTSSVLEKAARLKANRDELVKAICHRHKIAEENIHSTEFDGDFLKNSLKKWDICDFVFIAFLSAVYLALTCVAKEASTKGNDIHDAHSRKSKRSPNRYHAKMPNDTFPNPDNRYKPSGKINGVGLNHRYLFGHDLLKPFEILKDIRSITDVKPILGSKTLGAYVKQFFHIYYDLFSETGIAAPGSTYFLKFITKYLVKSNDDFIRYFSLHIEDIVVSGGIQACIYIYNRIRQYSGKKDKETFVKIIKDLLTVDMSNRTFKEYEMGIIAHATIIWLQLNLPDIYRGGINYPSIKCLINDLIQYIRINRKWGKEYKSLLTNQLYEIKNCELPNELRQNFIDICSENNIDYCNDVYVMCEKLETLL